MTGHEAGNPVAASRHTDQPRTDDRVRTVLPGGVVVPEAARHECLVCGEDFHLTPANHDGFGVVCPHCGGLN